MKFQRGDTIKMLTFKGDSEKPDEKFGRIVANKGAGKLLVATEEGPTIIWVVDEFNTEIIEEAADDADDSGDSD